MAAYQREEQAVAMRFLPLHLWQRGMRVGYSLIEVYRLLAGAVHTIGYLKARGSEHHMLDLTQERDSHIDQRLRNALIIWLSTVRADGRPHSAAVWFLWDGSHVLIFSQNNQKVRNLRQNPHVALAVDDTKDGDDVVTIEGTAELLDDPAITPVLPAYAAKYADQLQAMGWTAEQMGQSYSQAIRITPTKFHTVS